MHKLTMFVSAALAAATVAFGALAAAPSASARPSDECLKYKQLYYLDMRYGAQAVAVRDWVLASFYFHNAVDDAKMIGYAC